MTKEIKEIIDTSKPKFKYMLLSRLETDCKYFLGYGNRNKNVLWSGNVKEHIEDMRALYNSFPENDRPEWITLEKITEYEKEMKKGELLENTEYNGFLLTLGNKDYFLISEKKNITDIVACLFIEKIGEFKKTDTSIIENQKSNKQLVNNLKYYISKATIEKVATGKVVYFKITGKDFLVTIPENDSDSLIIFE